MMRWIMLCLVLAGCCSSPETEAPCEGCQYAGECVAECPSGTSCSSLGVCATDCPDGCPEGKHCWQGACIATTANVCDAVHHDYCDSSADCDDGDPCTADECRVKHCRHVDVRGCGAACELEESCDNVSNEVPCCRRGTQGVCKPYRGCIYGIDTDDYYMD